MHLTTIFRHRLLAGLATLTGLVAGSSCAQPTMPPKTEAAAKDSGEIKPGKLGELNVPIGGLGTFDPQRNVTISEIELSNGDVLTADAVAPDLKKVRLTGKLGGATKMTITFSDRTKAAYSVIVQPDYEQLKFVLKRAVPTASIDVIPGVGNVIILSGSVTKPEDADTAIRIASSAVGGSVANVINALNIGGSQHVLIDVTIAQVDRTELRERSFAFGIFGQTTTFSSVLGGASVTQGIGGAAGIFNTGSANLVSSIVPGQFVGALRALRTEGLSKFLSEPKLTTMSGRPALLRAGGRQAVLSASSGINGPGATLENIGTELEVLPIVRGDGKIYLELNPRITSVNNGRGITTAFGFTPGFNEQQTRTSVTLEPGQTFAIAGLIETTVQASTEKIPYLGDLPLLGAAFSSVRHEERETELLILVTPRLQEAMNCNQVPSRIPGKETRSVDDYELFLESLIEAPRGQRRPWGGNGPFGYNPAWKCAPGGFPCKNNVCPDGNCGTANMKAPCATGTCAAPGVVNHAGVTPQPLNVQPAGGFETVPLPTGGGSER